VESGGRSRAPLTATLPGDGDRFPRPAAGAKNNRPIGERMGMTAMKLPPPGEGEAV